MKFEEERERGCRSKVWYATWAEAEREADFHSTYTSAGLRPYHCIFCRGFHLTSRAVRNHQDEDCAV